MSTRHRPFRDRPRRARGGITVAELARQQSRSIEDVQESVDRLMAQGLVTCFHYEGEVRYAGTPKGEAEGRKLRPAQAPETAPPFSIVEMN